MRKLLGKRPDLTLAELRQKVGLECSLPAIHYALEKMGLTYKKRHFEPVNKTVRTSRGRAGSGDGAKKDSIPIRRADEAGIIRLRAYLGHPLTGPAGSQ